MIKRKLMAFLIAGAAITGLCGTYAAFVDSVTVNNHISTGIVDIRLDEFQEENGKLVAYQNEKIVLPGEQISKIPRVTNKGEPCYVRAKLVYEGDTEELEGLSDENVSGFSEDWVKKGEYYYYTKILDKKESVDIFDTLSIPETWTEAHSDQALSLTVRTDAIQAANFDPDFSAMSPWGDRIIELAVKEQDGEVQETQKNVKLSVEFDGKAHKLIAAPEDFFSNIPTAMPGDIFTDSVALSNTTDQEAELFFRTALKNQDAEQLDLLNNLGLEISYKDQVIYSGDLKAEDMKGYISLGKYQPGDTGELDFKVTVPKELNNAYALRDADVQWIFTVREKENPEQPNTGTGVSPNGGSPVEHGVSSVSPAKTGDESPIIAFVIIGASAATVAVIIMKRRKQK